MMVLINVVNLSEIQNKFRMEAEFYRPDYVANYKAVTSIPHVRLRPNTNKISDGTHFTPKYKKDGVRFYSAINVKENRFLHHGPHKFISAQEHAEIHRRCPVQSGDVLIRKVGVGPRWSCVVPYGLEEFSIFVSVALVRPDRTLDPYFLSTFINSKFGQLQLLRLNKGISQPDLHLEDIGELIVPSFSSQTQLEIARYVVAAESVEKQSLEKLHSAENILQAELGLDKLEFATPAGYCARFSELEISLRADPQHYQPRFDQLTSHLANFPTRRIRDIRRLNRRGIQPIYVENGAHAVVNSQHLGPNHINYDGLERTTEKLFNSAPEAHIQKDDLLVYTTGAHIGRTNVYLDDTPAFASNHVNILRLSPDIDHAYMAMVFQSIIGQFQTQKHARGSAQAELYPTDIDKFIVPLLPFEKQQEIGNLVRESLAQQRESARLLEQAKARVEKLIEEAVAA